MRSASVVVDTSDSGTGLISQWGEVISGSPGEIAHAIEGFAALEIDELLGALDPPGLTGIERMAPVLEALGY